MHLGKYLSDTINELKLVRWPTTQTTLKLTGLVIGISALVAVYVGSLDYLYTHLLSFIIK